jgi:DNA-binding CsgD family transcriptional regulator
MPPIRSIAWTSDATLRSVISLTMPARRPPVLLGRASERQMLDGLLRNVRGGQSAVLVVHGEAGVGKTALLHYCVRQASGLRVAQIAGVEAEMELPFAALHQLCAPMFARLDALPEPQRDALRVAFGMSSGAAPDRFLVALAVLSLLSAVAEERPLLCLVEDAQWLDAASGQVLGFVGRRLLAESVGIVVAVREPHTTRDFDGLPELPLGGLDDEDARALLARAIPGRLDDRIRDRIVAETRGNPLALTELPRGVTPAELAGGFRLPNGVALEGRIEESFQRRLDALPGDTRRLLLLAAAEPVGDSVLLWRAAAGLGIGADAAEPAEAAGLLALGGRMWFRHPLVRSAVYRAASPAERQTVHRALADGTDPDTDPDRRAWHRAAAASEPEESVAEELERSAGRAQARGGLAAAAAFLERAAALTRDHARRPQRLLAAAQAKFQAGALDAAGKLLAAPEIGRLDELQRAQVDRLHAQIAFALSQDEDVPSLLLKAAQRLEPLDAALAGETYLEALSAAMFVGHLAVATSAREVAEAACAKPRPAHLSRAPDLLLDGLATLYTAGYTAGAPRLRRALDAFRSERLSAADALRWLWLASHAATFVWDDESWHALSARQLRLARDAGALSVLPMALSTEIGVQVHAGNLAAATSLIEELDMLSEAIGVRFTPYGALALAAWRGREAEARDLIEAIGTEVAARSEGMGLTVVHWATAVLYNGLGRYDEALSAALRGSAPKDELGPAVGALIEVVEAAVRSDAPERAADALGRLTQMTRVSGTDWALGVEACARALLSEGHAAEVLYQEAIERLGRSRVRPLLARAHLVYGEWLRREQRRVDARAQLRAAHDHFTSMGMDAFAERARTELFATGEKARKRAVETRDDLTSQERQIARLAGDGLSNPEIGTRLFLSPRTVEWHLHKVFAKLEIRSRHELSDALPSSESELAPA